MSTTVNGFLNNMIIGAVSGEDTYNTSIEIAIIRSTYTRNICFGGACIGACTCSRDI